jgi:hypothetical protein
LIAAKGITTTRAAGSISSPPTLIFASASSEPAHLAHRKLLAGIQIDGGWIAGLATFAYDVGVGAHAFTRFGVVVVQREGMGLRLLQKVDDVAILVCALG